MNQTTTSLQGEKEVFASRVGRVQSSAVRDLLKYSKAPGVISLAGGIPAPDLFDSAGLREALAAVLDSGDTAAFQYGLTEGESVLRDQVAQLLRLPAVGNRIGTPVPAFAAGASDIRGYDYA